jgi:hypothetical protein
MITNVGISGAARRLGGYSSGTFWVMLGSVSGTTAVTTTGLTGAVAHGKSAKQTGSCDISVLNKFTLLNDFDSITISGFNVKQFGFMVGSKTLQTLWQIETISGVQFDGTNELQTEFTWRVF